MNFFPNLLLSFRELCINVLGSEFFEVILWQCIYMIEVNAYESYNTFVFAHSLSNSWVCRSTDNVLIICHCCHQWAVQQLLHLDLCPYPTKTGSNES